MITQLLLGGRKEGGEMGTKELRFDEYPSSGSLSYAVKGDSLKYRLFLEKNEQFISSQTETPIETLLVKWRKTDFKNSTFDNKLNNELVNKRTKRQNNSNAAFKMLDCGFMRLLQIGFCQSTTDADKHRTFR